MQCWLQASSTKKKDWTENLGVFTLNSNGPFSYSPLKLEWSFGEYSPFSDNPRFVVFFAWGAHGRFNQQFIVPLGARPQTTSDVKHC